MVEVIVLSLIQGITEFLPISSSAHLIIIPEFFLNIDSSRGFDVSLHFGSLLAVIYYLKSDLKKIISMLAMEISWFRINMILKKYQDHGKVVNLKSLD